MSAAASALTDISTPHSRLRNRALILQRAVAELLAEIEQAYSAPGTTVPSVRLSLRPTPMEVAMELATIFNLPVNVLLGKSRIRAVVDARHTAFWFGCVLSGCSQISTGINLGGFDHVTIGHGMRKVRTLWETHREFRARHDAIEKALCERFRLRVGAVAPANSPTVHFFPL